MRERERAKSRVDRDEDEKRPTARSSGRQTRTRGSFARFGRAVSLLKRLQLSAIRLDELQLSCRVAALSPCPLPPHLINAVARRVAPPLGHSRDPTLTLGFHLQPAQLSSDWLRATSPPPALHQPFPTTVPSSAERVRSTEEWTHFKRSVEVGNSTSTGSKGQFEHVDRLDCRGICALL